MDYLKKKKLKMGVLKIKFEIWNFENGNFENWNFGELFENEIS